MRRCRRHRRRGLAGLARPAGAPSSLALGGGRPGDVPSPAFPLTGRAPPAALRAAPGSWGALLSKMTSVLKSSTLRISGGTMFHRSSCPTYELGGASRAPWRHRAVSLPVMTSALPGGGSRRFRPPRPFPSFSAVQAQRRACTAHLPAELDRWAAGCV